eukprot:CAMPEP_0178595256 /NCGR_PEP_ID=MMETSP0697-20121206/30964_1 /TAXON_ID=265572 /ORGANISM="Extubocellulus spinifer, Strain CCMP396" /LENGTH=208 /DNA_ID=CAMNT_0020232649 /DNA_START=159 /DNA_END=786 /DNA_ORIENTATION=-
MGLCNTEGKKAKPLPVDLADATNTLHKKPAKASSVTNVKTRESKVLPTIPSMMSPGIGSTSPIPPLSPSPPTKPAAQDFDPSPASKGPVPELGLPTIEIDDTLAAFDDVTPPHLFVAMKDGDDGVIAALLSSLSPNAARVLPQLSSSDSMKSRDDFIRQLEGPPTGADTNSTSAMEFISVPSPDISQSSAPVNYQIVDNESRGPMAFV